MKKVLKGWHDRAALLEPRVEWSASLIHKRGSGGRCAQGTEKASSQTGYAGRVGAPKEVPPEHRATSVGGQGRWSTEQSFYMAALMPVILTRLTESFNLGLFPISNSSLPWTSGLIH